MTPAARSPYAGHRFPPEVIGHAVWLHFRFPLALRTVGEPPAARGVTVSHDTVRQWALEFGQAFANQIRRRLPRAGDEWHLDEVRIAGRKHWLWRAVDRDGIALDVLVERTPCPGRTDPSQPPTGSPLQGEGVLRIMAVGAVAGCVGRGRASAQQDGRGAQDEDETRHPGTLHGHFGRDFPRSARSVSLVTNLH
jgi:DDE domain